MQRAFILNKKPVDAIEDDTFKLVTRPLPALGNGQVLIQTLAMSNDPAQRLWIDATTDPVRSLPSHSP